MFHFAIFPAGGMGERIQPLGSECLDLNLNKFLAVWSYIKDNFSEPPCPYLKAGIIRSNLCDNLLNANRPYSFIGLASAMLSSIAATSHVWLLSIWNMTTEELIFVLFKFKLKNWYLIQFLENFVVYLEQLELWVFGTLWIWNNVNVNVNVMKSKHESSIYDENLVSELWCALTVKHQILKT